MAKVGFWLQGATGKLANSKLQSSPYGTIIGNNMNKPKNPKTVNQTLQRVLVNTVSQGYAGLRDICYHAFEGVTEGAKSMAKFQSENLKYFRSRAAEVGEEQLGNYINFVPVGQKSIKNQLVKFTVYSLRSPVTVYRIKRRLHFIAASA